MNKAKPETSFSGELSIRLPKKLQREIYRYISTQGITFSTFVERALEKAVRKRDQDE